MTSPLTPSGGCRTARRSAAARAAAATADIAPTAAALVGISVPAGVDGVDRRDALEQTRPSP
ncbi:MAG: hypothetical protein ACLF0P_11730 [Thermoanaerobaculia bacterium]